MNRQDFLVGLAIAVLAAFAAFDPNTGFLIALVFILVTAIAARGVETGIAVLAFLSPLLGLRLLAPPFEDGFLARFFPDGIDVRVADAFGIVLLLSVCTAFALRLIRGERARLQIQGWPFFIAFFLSALLSVPHAENKLLALKYALYPILFSFVIYVFIPVVAVRTRAALRRVLGASFAIGLVGAAMGALSFIIVPGTGLFRRATVLGLGTLYPFGANHNLLAETLVAASPLGFLLARRASPNRAFWLRAASIFIIVIALLTLARTAWIALAVEAILALALFTPRDARRALLRRMAPALIIAIPLITYLALFSRTPEVTGSNAARVALTDVSYYLFREHPLTGSGAGTFVERLGSVKDFTTDFGEPLDAHGFIQKIGAEQGILGILVFLALFTWIFTTLYRAHRALPPGASGDRALLLTLFLSVAGSVVYQLFNTSYYNAKLWLPVGLALAAASIVSYRRSMNSEV